ncbi:hypothetical protein F0U60_42430 [Archangium minus]|uniref:Lipoprotein n=1 Tax=Archangium minus TaxID=83450 RepID=A0ABY9X3R2_9BACT|nr:hypothetical protein F0U60_42430 [Archangium minus]
MKSAVSIVVSLAASILLACGVGPESAVDESVSPSSTGPESSSAPEVSESTVSPMACVTLYRPRYSSWWSSFPIEVDGQMGGCETHDDCTTTCWGVETPYYMHEGFFYCTYCP